MRARDHGVVVGLLPPGPANAITDVPGVGVGHAGPPDAGGVTVVVPRLGESPWRRPCHAGVAVLNGAGALTGRSQLEEWGLLETPVLLTGTPYVGAVYDAAALLLAEAEPLVGHPDGDVVIPVVGECDPSGFIDARGGPRPDLATVRAALASAAGGAVAEGQVGAGVGMSVAGWAGGIGTASRRLPEGETVGVLVLANFGDAERLTLPGGLVGPRLPDPGTSPKPGSCIVVTATDAPLLPGDLARLARRTFLGLARTGSYGSHGSGEIAMAFTTANADALARDADARIATLRAVVGAHLSPLLAAASEAAEEAVLNALAAGRTLVGGTGAILPACPFEQAAALAGGARG